MEKLKNFFEIRLFYVRCFIKKWLFYLGLKARVMPGIRHIFRLREAFKYWQKVKDMNSYELYLESKEQELEAEEIKFRMFLVQLLGVIRCIEKDEGLFNEAKTGILKSRVIEPERFKDFKAWVENVEINETDYSPIESAWNILEQADT